MPVDSGSLRYVVRGSEQKQGIGANIRREMENDHLSISAKQSLLGCSAEVATASICRVRKHLHNTPSRHNWCKCRGKGKGEVALAG